MDLDGLISYNATKAGVEETFPFDEDTLVFKVMGKIFSICALERIPAQVNLKCDPERAVSLREEYDGLIYPGFHMNKTHWNTVEIENNIPIGILLNLIDHSYDLVVMGLTKKLKDELHQL